MLSIIPVLSMVQIHGRIADTLQARQLASKIADPAVITGVGITRRLVYTHKGAGTAAVAHPPISKPIGLPLI